eukprot:s596_g19.t6
MTLFAASTLAPDTRFFGTFSTGRCKKSMHLLTGLGSLYFNWLLALAVPNEAKLMLGLPSSLHSFKCKQTTSMSCGHAPPHLLRTAFTVGLGANSTWHALDGSASAVSVVSQHSASAQYRPLLTHGQRLGKD